MKKRLWMMFLLAALILSIMACGSKSELDQVQEPDQEINSKPENKPEEDSESKPEEPEVSEPEAVAPVKVVIYFSNGDATAFNQEEIEIAEITPQVLADNLSAKGVFPSDVQVLSCKEVQVDGVNALNLDLSEAFDTYLKGLGTAGEYMTMGSVSNTFLKAYNCEKILVTVAGETLASGHTEYPDYMFFFE